MPCLVSLYDCLRAWCNPASVSHCPCPCGGWCAPRSGCELDVHEYYYTKFLPEGAAAHELAAHVIAKKDAALPVYTVQEVAKHCRRNDFWVTYKDSVYDLTDYIDSHPGGWRMIFKAAGSSVDSWFHYYGAHLHSWEAVEKVLRRYLIGKLDASRQGAEDYNFFAGEPHEERVALKANKEKPYEGEPVKLPFSFLTPAADFFVRNHRPVPVFQHYTNLSGTDLPSITIEHPENLGTFSVHPSVIEKDGRQVDLPVTFQCTGNRIDELIRYKNVGVQSDVGLGKNYIANACWTGVRLTDLLAHFFEGPGQKDAFVAKYPHMEITGADGFRIGLPSGHVLDVNNDVIIAHRMNGELITRDHGFPVRFIAPGLPSARSVKWPTMIKFLKEESNSPWQLKYYRRAGVPLYAYPVQSIITSHGGRIGMEVSAVRGTPVKVHGVAHAGHGIYDKLRNAAATGKRRTVASIHISLDMGSTWEAADLLSAPVAPNACATGEDAALQKLKRFPNGDPDKWAWTRFSFEISEAGVRRYGKQQPSSTSSFELEVWSRAVDNEGNKQPEQIAEVWTGDLYYNNAVDKVRLLVEV